MKTYKFLASYSYSLIILTLLLFISCDESSIAPIAEREIMNLDSLSIGQEFSFAYFRGYGYGTEKESFHYTGDTLVLSVLDMQDNRFLISERLTDHSTAMTNDSPSDNVWRLDSNDRYRECYWTLRNDSLIIDGSSILLFVMPSVDNRYFDLRTYTESEVDITGWKTAYPHVEERVELYTVDYKLFNYTYDSLNVLINNGAMSVDLGGTTTVYSRNHGIVKSTLIASVMYGEGVGWDRL